MSVPTSPTEPKALRDPAVRRSRMAMLDEPHVRPLTEFVRRIRQETGRGEQVPFFDPLDAGTGARCLFVLQAPGRKAVESGFVSRENPDESARHFLALTRDAGLHRDRTATWNIVPWHAEGEDIGPAEIQAGLRYLFELLRLLPSLQVVAFLGGKAQKAAPQVARARPELARFDCPLPSPLFINRSSENRARALGALRRVADAIR